MYHKKEEKGLYIHKYEVKMLKLCKKKYKNPIQYKGYLTCT